MTGTMLEQRCWNHETREAVCLCLECGRSFCRECVSEHEGRLLCAACLRNKARAAGVSGGKLRHARTLCLSLAGVILGWAIFFGAAESVITIAERSERVSWQGK